MKRQSALWFATALLCAGAAHAKPLSLPSRTFPAPFGVNIHFTRGKPGEVKALAAAFKMVRMDFIWENVEKKKGVYDFKDYDVLVRDMEAAGVRPLFILDYGNKLYGTGPVRTAAQRAGYSAFAVAAVKHYKGHKILWEFWNEPNLTGFWGDRADPLEYAAMVNNAAPRILKADPNATLLLGAFSGFPWDYMETVFQRGCLKWVDAVTVHPYRGGIPETVSSDYIRLRRLLAQYAPNRDIPLLSGEWGYSTNRKTGVSELTQAQYLVRQRLINVRCGIGLSIWYDWKDDGPNPDENEHRFGSTKQDFSPKPSYTAARVMTSTLAGYDFVRMLADGPDVFAMLLRNTRGESAVALWTLNKETTYTLPAVPLKVVGMLGEKATAARSLKIGPSPRYAFFGKKAPYDIWSFVKPYSVVFAGQKTKSAFVISNPDTKPRMVEISFGLKGGSVKPGAVSLTIAPGKQATVPVSMEPRLRSEDTTVTVTINRKPSVIPLVVANPVALSVNGSRSGQVQVTLDAPGVRTAETVTVRATDSAGKPVGSPAKVSLKPGTVLYTVSLKVPPVTGAVKYGAMVMDGKGNTIASLAPTAFVRMLDLNAMTMGQAPPGLAVHYEGDEKPGGSAEMKILSDPKMGKVVDLVAHFPEGWRYFVVTPQRTSMPDSTVAVGMWVNGDACGDFIRIRFADAKGQTFQPTYGPVNWKGWRWITIRLDDASVGSWGGPQDGRIHQPIKWDCVFLLDSASRRPHTTHLQLTGFTLMTR